MSEKAGPKRTPAFEGWLRDLIAVYQDRRLKPRDRRYSNLTRMPRPTQMCAITLRQGASNIAVVIITHRKEVENGISLAVRVNSIEELAEFSEIADDHFGTSSLVREDLTGGRVLFPQVKVAEQACMALAQMSRRSQGRLPLARGDLSVGSMHAIQVLPSAALWEVWYRAPLPEHRSVLLKLERRTKRPTKSRAPEPAPVAQPGIQRAVAAYAAFPEPLVWFGPPPYPSPRDRILQRMPHPAQLQRLLYRGRVGDVETLAYSNGLILAVTDNRRVALSTINQIFSVLSRSGVESLALPDFELIEVTQLDAESGEIKGSHTVVTPRNSLLDVPSLDKPTLFSSSLPEDIVGPLLDLADRCASDRDQSVASLRLLNAVTLFRRQFFTEAFVTGWTLIETSIERDFEAFWLARGRSKAAIAQMDWTASQRIDLLIAVGDFDPTLGEQIHRLRKRRNAIVHDLADTSERQARDCIEVASAMTPLPQFPEPLRPQIVFL